jgi:hypothetical protein
MNFIISDITFYSYKFVLFVAFVDILQSYIIKRLCTNTAKDI